MAKFQKFQISKLFGMKISKLALCSGLAKLKIKESLMKQIRSSNLILVFVLVCGFMIGYFARTAFAADTNFTLADAALEKAIVLLELAQVPADKPKCDKFRLNAKKLAEKARVQVSKAIACSDAP
jgi:hypothetical protein